MFSQCRSFACVGEGMIELQDTPGGVVRRFGGDTLNAAVYMARIAPPRTSVAYVTALGDDSFSEAMIVFFRSERLEIDMVRRIPGKLPGLYYISLDQDGERTFSYWRGDAAARRMFDGPDGERLLARLGEFDCVHYSGISLAILTAEGRERLLARLAALRAAGRRVVFDANYRPRLWGQAQDTALAAAREAYQRFARHCDLALMTVEEAAVFGAARLPDSDMEMAGFCTSLGIPEVVVKDGGRPCRIWSDMRLSSVPAVAVGQPTDTTAAGDAFAAAYIVARGQGADPKEAARRAHLLASAVIGCHGAIIPLDRMPSL